MSFNLNISADCSPDKIITALTELYKTSPWYAVTVLIFAGLILYMLGFWVKEIVLSIKFSNNESKLYKKYKRSHKK